MDDAHTRSLVVVVCDRFDRLDASPALAANVIAFLEGEGVRLVFLDEGVDADRLTREPLARLARTVVGASPPSETDPRSGSGNGLRVATYARVAGAGPGAHAAIDSQLRLAETFVAAQRRSSGWAVQSHVSYRDLGTSGKDRDRPGLLQLEHDLAAGQIDVVICASLDRIARNVMDLLELLELFQAHGARFIAVRDDIGVPISPSTPPAVVEALLRARSFDGPRPRA
jgi:DNA invertase Pin-like site-specific DNA recombinase